MTYDVDGQNVTLTAGVAAIGKAIKRRHLDVHYIFNLETDGLAPGSFNLSLVAGEDRTVHLVGFTVK